MFGAFKIEFWSVMFHKGHTKSYREQYDLSGERGMYHIWLTNCFIGFFTFAKLKNSNSDWLNKFRQLPYGCSNSEESSVQFLQALVQIRTASKAMSSDFFPQFLMLQARDSILRAVLLRTGKNTEQWGVISVHAVVGVGGEEINQKEKIKGQLGIIKDK